MNNVSNINEISFQRIQYEFVNSVPFKEGDLIELFNNREFDTCIQEAKNLLTSKTSSPLVYSVLGCSLSFQNKFNKALEVFFEGINEYPNDGELYNNLATLYQKKHDYIKAEAASLMAIKLIPNSSISYFTLAITLNALKKTKEAISTFKTSFKKNPSNFDALKQIGNIYKDEKKFSDALNIYRKMQKLFPSNVEGFYNESCLHIRNQRFLIGWKGYDFALKNNSRQPEEGYYEEQKELWDGKFFKGTLLIYGEQGLGDQLLFGSLIKDLIKEQNIVLKVNYKLIDIFKETYPEIKVYGSKDLISNKCYEKYISIGSLCKFLRKNNIDFKNSTFLNYSVPKNKYTNLKMMPNNNKLNIGLSWFSFAEETGRTRSLKINEVSQLLSQHDHNFINLQYGEIQNQIDLIQSNNNKIISIPNVDLTNDINSLSEIITNCDLVITIDNTAAHLSGSLGIPTWILLPYSADCRWFENTSLSLWYKTVKLFRQGKSKNWSEVLQNISLQLKEFSNSQKKDD